MINKLQNNTNNEANLNVLQAYNQNTVSNINFTGTILRKNGKEIIMKTSSNEIYDIKTKINLDVKSGQNMLIKKSQIESIVKISDDQIEAQKEHRKELEEKLDEMDLEKSEENVDGADALRKFDIPLTRENVIKFVSLKQGVNEIKSELNMDILAKVMRDRSFDDVSVFDVAKLAKDRPVRIKAKVSDEDITAKYDEARKISKEIYNGAMGKDVYDIIIALKENGVEITQENIDKMYDAFAKLSDIKDVDDKTVIDAMNSGASTMSIDLLYKIKNYVSTSGIDVSNKVYTNTSVKSVPTDSEIEKLTPEIEKMLKELGFDSDSVKTAKLMLKKSMDISKENLDMVKDIKDTIDKIADLLDKDTAAVLMSSDIDISSMDINQLLDQINAIIAGAGTDGIAEFTREQMDTAGILIDAVKQLQQDNVLLSSYKVKSILSSNLIGQELYDKLFGEHYNYKTVDYKSAILAKTSMVLSTVDKPDFDKIDIMSNRISLRDIGKLAHVNFKMTEPVEKVLDLQSVTFDAQYTEISSAKQDLQFHYNYLRLNMRASHVRMMIFDGIDPYQSDIRVLSEIVSTQIEASEQTKKMFAKNDSTNENEAITRLISSGAELTFGNFRRSFEMSANSYSYISKLDKLEEFVRQEEFDETAKRIKDIVRKFDVSNFNAGHPDDYRRHLQKNVYDLYSEIKKIQTELDKSGNPAKDKINEHLKEFVSDVKHTRILSKQSDMIQVPFYMNGESSNANVYARTKKNAKGKIDPDDMSILIDLNTRNLGKVGFYIKAEGRKLSVKISADSSSIAKLRQNISVLDSSFAGSEYSLNSIDLQSPQNKAKIEFVEENVPDKNSNIDMVI